MTTVCPPDTFSVFARSYLTRKRATFTVFRQFPACTRSLLSGFAGPGRAGDLSRGRRPAHPGLPHNPHRATCLSNKLYPHDG